MVKMQLKTDKQKIIEWLTLRKDFDLTIIENADYIVISLWTVGKSIKIENIYNKTFEQAKKEINSKITDLVVNANE